MEGNRETHFYKFDKFENFENFDYENDKNMYQLLITLREKNNNLLINLQEHNNIKNENLILKRSLKEIEISLNLLTDENK